MTGNQASLPSRYQSTFCDLKTLFHTPHMISIKDHFYQCWLCFYGPVFWLIYMVKTSLELNRNYSKITDNNNMIFSLYDDLQVKGDIMEINNTLEFNSDDNAYSPTSTVSTPTTSSNGNSDEDDDTQSIQSNRSFKSTLKTRFQNFKLKQQSLNEAMKRSLLRKSSKSSLSQTSFSSDSSNNLKTSSSLSSSPPATAALSSSSPLSPPTFISSLNYYSQDIIGNDKLKRPLHPLALDRQVSVSDSLLKSINKKGKQPPTTMAVTSSSHPPNEDYSFKSRQTSTSDLCNKGGGEKRVSPNKPSIPHRRKTSPEINRLS